MIHYVGLNLNVSFQLISTNVYILDFKKGIQSHWVSHVCAAFGHDPWTLRFYMTVSPQHPGVTGCAWSHKIIRPTHEVAVSSGLKVKIQVEIKDIIGYKQLPKKKVKSMSWFQILTWYFWLDSNLCSKTNVSTGLWHFKFWWHLPTEGLELSEVSWQCKQMVKTSNGRISQRNRTHLRNLKRLCMIWIWFNIGLFGLVCANNWITNVCVSWCLWDYQPPRFISSQNLSKSTL